MCESSNVVAAFCGRRRNVGSPASLMRTVPWAIATSVAQTPDATRLTGVRHVRDSGMGASEPLAVDVRAASAVCRATRTTTAAATA